MNQVELAKAFVSLSGVLIPTAVMLWIWSSRNIVYYAVTCAVALSLGTLNMDRIIPFFGWHVAGGSFWFSYAVVAFVMIIKRFGLRKARLVLSALMVGQVLTVLGATRWLAHSFTDPIALQNGDYLNDLATVRNGVVTLIMFYLSSVIALFVRKRKMFNLFVRTLTDCFFGLVLTAPFAVQAVVFSNPGLSDCVACLTIATVLARTIIPMIFLAILWRTPEGDLAEIRYEGRSEGSGRGVHSPRE